MSYLVVHCKRAAFDVYIGRPGIWGNPFSFKPNTRARYVLPTREEALAAYEEWLLAQPALVAKVKAELKGKVLGCWCAPLSCHGDILTRVANEPESAAPLAERSTDLEKP
jgi:hypothetical protein